MSTVSKWLSDLLFAGILFAMLFGGCYVCNKCNSDKPAETESISPREQKIKDQFNTWDGSHKGLEAWVKRQMNDPGSYEHVESRWGDNGDRITVSLTFRGKNVYGGVVTQTAIADFDLEGNMIGSPVTK